MAELYKIPLDCVLYDTMNFFTLFEATNESYLARTGHNKHGWYNLRRVGLALSVTKDVGLPLLHMLYHERQADAKLFPGSMTELVDRFLKLSRGSNRLTVVFDKGNNSKVNIQKAKEMNLRVVGSLVPSHYRDLTGVRLGLYDLEVNGKPVYHTVKEAYGLKLSVAVVYNASSYRRQKRSLLDKVRQFRDEVTACFESHESKPIGEIEQRLQDILHGNEHARYLKVQVTGRRYKTLSCSLDRKAYCDKLRTLGKTIIFTNDLDMPVEEMVNLYMSKNLVEEQFKQLNNPAFIAFRPIYHWTDTKLKVYALICVLALLVQIMNLRARMNGIVMSNAVLRVELGDILEVALIYSPSRVVKRITVLSNVQKQLFDVFNLQRYAPRKTELSLPLETMT